MLSLRLRAVQCGLLESLLGCLHRLFLLLLVVLRGVLYLRRIACVLRGVRSTSILGLLCVVRSWLSISCLRITILVLLRYWDRRRSSLWRRLEIGTWWFRCWPQRKEIAIDLWRGRRLQPKTLRRYLAVLIILSVLTARHRWWGSRILKALPFVLRKARACRRAHHGLSIAADRREHVGRHATLWALVGSRIVEFVICPVIAVSVSVLVEKGNDVDDCAWILLLLLLCDTVGFECPLPLLR